MRSPIFVEDTFASLHQVYYFPRAQGFSAVPSSDPYSIGMTQTHIYEEYLSAEDLHSERENTSELNPLSYRQRLKILQEAWVTPINHQEAVELHNIRKSRKSCGCSCIMLCDPKQCECTRDMINCQIGHLGHPCGCVSDTYCFNPYGRHQKNFAAIRHHFNKTMEVLKKDSTELEKKE